MVWGLMPQNGVLGQYQKENGLQKIRVYLWSLWSNVPEHESWGEDHYTRESGNMLEAVQEDRWWLPRQLAPATCWVMCVLFWIKMCVTNERVGDEFPCLLRCDSCLIDLTLRMYPCYLEICRRSPEATFRSPWVVSSHRAYFWCLNFPHLGPFQFEFQFIEAIRGQFIWP